MSTGPKYYSTVAPEGYYEGLAERVRANLLPALDPFLSKSRRALELASGNGSHAKLYTETYPELELQPTEADEYLCGECNLTNDGNAGVAKAIVLDVMEDGYWHELEQAASASKYDLVLANNCFHMIPCAWTQAQNNPKSSLAYEPNASSSRRRANLQAPALAHCTKCTYCRVWTIQVSARSAPGRELL